jgi:D-alanyl-D-alanine carboxypeptidase/D-alanyl-D-alanine-endopeptidase (penicillin-binding protein 4)
MKNLRNIILTIFFLLFSGITQAASLPPWASEVISLIENGGVYVESYDGKPIFDYQGSTSFVPASTLKLVTGLAALEILKKDYRFKTEFYLDGASNLYIKGYGDPYLVSEELSQIAGVLKNKGLRKVNQIVLDPGYFEEIKVPGVSASLNPYDALNSALSANFNTIFVQKSKGGEVTSAEEQTPMTELTRTLAQKAPLGKSRINLAAHPEESLLYVGYLMKAFLEEQGVSVTGSIHRGSVSGKLFYQHFSSKSLEQVIQGMMKYSTNFIANQLFLTLGAEKLGAPANLAKGKKVVSEFLRSQLALQNFNIEEGSGISRENKMTPMNMVKVLRAFESYRYLLPEKFNGILAKTGTLNGVSSLAGYFDSSQNREVRFAILLNQKEGNREKIAKVLYQNLH